MKLNNNNTLAVTMFKTLLENEIDSVSLAKEIDEIMITYAKYLIDDADNYGYKNRSKGIYYLACLRNVCMGIDELTG